MFEQISSALNRWLENVRQQKTLSEKELNQLWSELRIKLLESDVHFKVVKEIIDSLQKKVAQEPLQKGGAHAQVVFYRLIYRTLLEILGQDPVAPNWQNPYLCLLTGLNGMGKTTFAAKYAHWIRQNRRMNVGLVTLDDQRPAAYEQLQTLANSANIPFFAQLPQKPFNNFLHRALDWMKSLGLEALVVDTAGRHQWQPDLMEELKQIHETLSWSDTFFVIDSGFGQQAISLVQGFQQALPLTGVIATRVDADSKAGALLSIKWVTGLPIKFFSSGEKISDIEVFYPDRIVKRMLDLGDLETLVEKTHEAVDEKELRSQQEKFKKGQMTLEDFLAQMRLLRKLGGFEGILKYLPGFQVLRQQHEALSQAKQQFRKWEAIILSMTPQERQNPKILNSSRKNRIAKGSGTTLQDINQFLRAYEQMQQIMKLFSQTDGPTPNLKNFPQAPRSPFWKNWGR